MTPQELREWRKRHNLTQAQAGELLGRDAKTIGRLEEDGAEIPKLVELACRAIDGGSRVPGLLIDSWLARPQAVTTPGAVFLEVEREQIEVRLFLGRFQGHSGPQTYRHALVVSNGDRAFRIIRQSDGLFFAAPAAFLRTSTNLEDVHLTKTAPRQLMPGVLVVGAQGTWVSSYEDGRYIFADISTGEAPRYNLPSDDHFVCYRRWEILTPHGGEEVPLASFHAPRFFAE